MSATDRPNLEEYMRSSSQSFALCETWEEVDEFTMAVLELAVPDFIHVLC